MQRGLVPPLIPSAHYLSEVLMTHRHHSVFAGCVILAATAACAGANRGGSPSEGPTMIVFKNESLEQADVFAVRRGAGALRLGTVFGGRTDTLKIRHAALPHRTTALVAAGVTGRLPISPTVIGLKGGLRRYPPTSAGDTPRS